MIIHKGTLTLTTRRLALRRFEAKDARSAFENWLGDPAVSSFLGRRPVKSVEESEAIVANMIRSYRQKDFYHWAVDYRGEIAGMISVSGYSERDGWADIGWSISSFYQNRGFAAEAAGEVMRFLFDGVGFARLQAVCAVDNIPSIRVMEKLGMAREGTLRRYFVDAAGAAHDCYLYALLSSDREKSSR